MALNKEVLTQELVRAGKGDAQAARRVWELVYHELQQMAHRALLHERKDHTYSTVDLVHEVYMRLFNEQQVDFQGRRHFYGIAARSMKQILIEYARRKNAQKRGAGAVHVSLDEALTAASEQSAMLLDLNEALDRLSELNERQAQVVELRFFGGFQNDEIAEALDISVRTVTRDWNMAKVWLSSSLSGTPQE